jgi:hypothetical protein
VHYILQCSAVQCTLSSALFSPLSPPTCAHGMGHGGHGMDMASNASHSCCVVCLPDALHMLSVSLHLLCIPMAIHAIHGPWPVDHATWRAPRTKTPSVLFGHSDTLSVQPGHCHSIYSHGAPPLFLPMSCRLPLPSLPFNTTFFPALLFHLCNCAK